MSNSSKQRVESATYTKKQERPASVDRIKRPSIDKVSLKDSQEKHEELTTKDDLANELRTRPPSSLSVKSTVEGNLIERHKSESNISTISATEDRQIMNDIMASIFNPQAKPVKHKKKQLRPDGLYHHFKYHDEPNR